MTNLKSGSDDMYSSSPLRLKTLLDVWVLYSDDEFKLHMARELVQCLGVNFEFIPEEKVNPDLFKTNNLPDLLFVQTGHGWAQKIAKLQHADIEQDEQHEMSLVVFGDESDNESLRMALRLGASDYLSDTASAKDLMHLLTEIAENKISTSKLAELFVFINTKGGAGATTIGLNLAVDVAMHIPENVLFLDLDSHFGVAADYLNLNPVYSVVDAIDSQEDLDEMSLQGLVTKHESGLHMLNFNPETRLENYEKSKQIAGLIPILRRYYKYIFVDFSQGIDGLFTSVLTQASNVFLVTQQNLVALKNASSVIRSLKFEYGIAAESMSIVVNRYEKKQQIKLKDIQSSLAGVNVMTIPNDFKVAIESTNLGKPFVMAKPNAVISKSIHEFSAGLCPDVQSEQGWLDRLFS
ncbi:AAA family ATPase [Vibrio salinus]|uniref:AAA family ATPase n=1 Tax=Vibrio salinus TaxID=2899784 RepID=UPI001E2F91A9|nr:AAA family ATPase [Vibrio salinus]MCE0494320.1 AAA family ATPase [Vibrio salinus]